MDVPQVRRVEVPRWINTRTVLGILLFSLSFLGAQRLLAVKDETAQVWVVTRPLGTGESISSGDVRLGDFGLPGEQIARYAAGATDLVGATVVRPIAEGELVPLSSVARIGSDDTSRRMTVPIESAHAVGGDLQPGDVVDVFATFDAEVAGARTVMVASNVEVGRIVTAGGLVGEEAAVGVTLSVTAEEAAELVFALRTGSIDVVKVVASSEAGTRTVTSEDVR